CFQRRMRMSVMSIAELDPAQLNGKRVLMRVDFNVPLHAGQIENDQRIRAALPTLDYLLTQGARVILMSHLGRPKGKVNEAFRLQPVGEHLAKLLGREVLCLPDCVGAEAQTAYERSDAQVVLLENT